MEAIQQEVFIMDRIKHMPIIMPTSSKVNDIVEFGNAKRWGRQQNLDAIESLREDTRLGLREGEIKCY